MGQGAADHNHQGSRGGGAEDKITTDWKGSHGTGRKQNKGWQQHVQIQGGRPEGGPAYANPTARPQEEPRKPTEIQRIS